MPGVLLSRVTQVRYVARCLAAAAAQSLKANLDNGTARLACDLDVPCAVPAQVCLCRGRV